MFYGARYYDVSLGRFTQPDTLVPSPLNPQSLNRFAYVLNNPVKYTDPTGHAETCEESCGQEGTGNPSEEEDKDTACAENDTDCDDVPDDEQTDTPADTGSDQTPDHEDVQQALQEGDPYLSETQIAVGLFEKGYNPYTDPRFNSFADYDQANLIWYYTLWTYQKRQDAGIGGSLNDLGSLLLAGAPLAAVGGVDFGNTLRPGPFAVESIPARGPMRNFSSAERAEIDRIGYTYGCHTCGTRDPGTSSGHFIPDHQPVSALNTSGEPQVLYPHCQTCSWRQGGEVREAIRLGLGH
jgi:hypothetical protein